MIKWEKFSIHFSYCFEIIYALFMFLVTVQPAWCFDAYIPQWLHYKLNHVMTPHLEDSLSSSWRQECVTFGDIKASQDRRMIKCGGNLDHLLILTLGIHSMVPGSSDGKKKKKKKNLPAMQKTLVWFPGSGRFSWRREWQPTPVFLRGESQGQRRPVAR